MDEIQLIGAVMLLRLIRNFLRRESGNVALIVTIAMVPMIMTAGASIDFVRAHQATTALQQAIDAAGLASGSDPGTNPGQVVAMAQAFLDANAQQLVLKPERTTITVREVGGIKQVGINATAELETTFMRIMNIDTLDVSINSMIQRKEAGPLQVALVLDTTGSMSMRPAAGGTQTKIQALRAAASGLVNDLMTAANPNLQMGVVPYAGNVRLYTAAQALSAGFVAPAWLKPQTMATSCSVNPVPISPCNIPMCWKDGLFRESNDCCGWTCPSGVAGTSVWEGCVGPRSLDNAGRVTNAFLTTIANPTSPPYPGVPRQAWQCGGQVLLPLTSNRNAVISRINSLSPEGDTFIPTGLTWGWNVLASAELYGAESMASVEARGGRKVLVLMTDGLNSLGIHTGHGRLMPFSGPAQGNALTAQLCTQIKNTGIQIFTVLFDVNDETTRNMLRNCASSPSMAFNASDSADLTRAFGAIGNQLRTVKLTQ
jgi:Flp pilus assembly protein TadG